VQPAVQPTSSDLKDLLENVGPDELATALALADWDNEQLKELVKILSSRLKPVPADLTIPAGLANAVGYWRTGRGCFDVP
jgi:hypothetical protein